MKKMSIFCTAILIVVLVVFSNALALPINSPVPSNAYIEFNGLDWAWASPCAGGDCGGGYGQGIDLSYQAAFGWRMPTLAELALAPLAPDFIVAGGNVPLGGSDPVSGAVFHVPNSSLNGDAALAVPYFNDIYNWGDWANAPGSGGLDGFPLLAWNGVGGEAQAAVAESLVVRNVPEPSLLYLLGSGLVGLAIWRKRIF